jgi:hypothetical protein
VPAAAPAFPQRKHLVRLLTCTSQERERILVEQKLKDENPNVVGQAEKAVGHAVGQAYRSPVSVGPQRATARCFASLHFGRRQVKSWFKDALPDGMLPEEAPPPLFSNQVRA